MQNDGRTPKECGRLEFRGYWLLTVMATEALSVREPLVPVTVTV